ncbi:tyrosine-type recombinase/integrase [Micromonospora sp. WMMD1274]|uniref:tyrosine-type recombinase/integrase n=1 Tax=Micromonospora sp. WMMD1274 TaxID=3404116 RepID=UPI003B95AB68
MSELIAEHIAHLRAKGHSDRTIEARDQIIRRLHDHLPYGLAWASVNELDHFLAHPRWSRWTRATYAMHIRGFYRWATAGGHLDGDPSIDMAKPRNPKCLPHPVTDDELIQALNRSTDPWYTAILLASHEGLRASEICRLTRADVSEDHIRLIGKGGDPEIVYTHPVVWKHVKDRPPGRLVRGPSGQDITGRWLSQHQAAHFRRIGLPGLHMHRFRHWFATTLMDSGASLRTVQEALRHSSVTSTQIYTKVRSGQRRLAIRSLPTPLTQHPATSN